MKRLNKIQISPERVINNDALMTIKGGYDPDETDCNVICTNDHSICKRTCTQCIENPCWAGMWVCV